ncbi:WD40 repeat-like protein [Athelia psychrophila]|uniref:DNA damage-binding protein CMR1 n=1 Tax=Athelia psychrophila TaxID=1759441 RepID=A0A166I2S4_9AGAM|nr:WD40 repeat-like protein [Fibularhizoctonia sp. CBS 109695]
MPKISAYEIEREANIARNRALLEQLELKETVASLGLPSAAPGKSTAKPVQPNKRVKREREEAAAPRRASARLRTGPYVDPNESPKSKKEREAEQEEARAREAEEALEAEERARAAKRPRHDDLVLATLVEDADPMDLSSLSEALKVTSQPRRVGTVEAMSESREAREIQELRDKLQGLKVVSRAKVTQDRIYSAAYHPEVTKDLIFFGDKHGQLGIWDARAPRDEVGDDETAESTSKDEQERGKYWRLQTHWPATSKSSISCVKFDPIDSHNVYTSAYDSTIRALSFTTSISREIFHAPDALITSIDLPSSGHEMWVSDSLGGLTHLDLREDKTARPRWYGLSDHKIGCISVNPREPHFLLTASNSKMLSIWDARKLSTIPVEDLSAAFGKDVSTPIDFDSDTVKRFCETKKGEGCHRGEWQHGKSASSAYWDPRGRNIVSTSYDDSLRLWDIDTAKLKTSGDATLPKPFRQIKHNCQTGKWLTILRAQWSLNTDCYPHFTVGNMEHSLDIYSSKGDVIAKLADRSKITAVQAVTCSHPNITERAASGNASGRCVLWAPADLADS